MTPNPYSEDHLVEQPALALLAELGWQTACGLEETFAPEGGSLGRRDRRVVVLQLRLRAALERLNPDQPPEAISAAIEELSRNRSAMGLVAANREVYQLLKDGVVIASSIDKATTLRIYDKVQKYWQEETERVRALLEQLPPEPTEEAEELRQRLQILTTTNMAALGLDIEPHRCRLTSDASAQLRALAHYGVTARMVQTADFQLLEEQIARGIPVPCGYIHRGPMKRPTGSGHWLIVYGHTPTHVVVNDPWGEPDLIGGTTVNANGMGLRFSRLNDRCAGLRLRQALDGGAIVAVPIAMPPARDGRWWWTAPAEGCTDQRPLVLGLHAADARTETAAESVSMHWIQLMALVVDSIGSVVCPAGGPAQPPGLSPPGEDAPPGARRGAFPIPEALTSKPFVYYCKQDPWQDDLDDNHGLPVLLARRSDEPGSEAIWCAQRQVWKPFPCLLGRLLGGDWWDQMSPEQAERCFGAAAIAGSAISV